ncbi:MAG TPA: ribosome-associated translation inhibitor RaiA, partial [Thermoanaerobaculia bacterium]
MATEISGRNYEIPPDVRELVEKKLAKITERLFDDVIDVRVVLQVEKYRNICEILIAGKEHDVKTVQESDASMEDAINAAIDHVKRQAQK